MNGVFTQSAGRNDRERAYGISVSSRQFQKEPGFRYATSKLRSVRNVLYENPRVLRALRGATLRLL